MGEGGGVVEVEQPEVGHHGPVVGAKLGGDKMQLAVAKILGKETSQAAVGGHPSAHDDGEMIFFYLPEGLAEFVGKGLYDGLLVAGQEVFDGLGVVVLAHTCSKLWMLEQKLAQRAFETAKGELAVLAMAQSNGKGVACFISA